MSIYTRTTLIITQNNPKRDNKYHFVNLNTISIIVI